MRADDYRLGFSGSRASELAGITYRQLDYWTRIGLIVPSIQSAKGSGTRRRFSARDVRILAALGTTEPRMRPMLAEALRTNTECHRLVLDNRRGRIYCIVEDADILAAVHEARSVSFVDLDTILPDLVDA